MAYVCKGRCYSYKFVRTERCQKIYDSGGKRCDTCDIYMKWDGNWCPCCGNRLSSKPHKLTMKGIVQRVGSKKLLYTPKQQS